QAGQVIYLNKRRDLSHLTLPSQGPMHGESFTSDKPADLTIDHRPWWQLLNRYHWFVLIVASLGWLFDTMDQQLFTIARLQAMQSLVVKKDMDSLTAKKEVDFHAGLATSIFLIGWGTGGIAFGIIADLMGRARSMIFTILLYSIFTGLSALSVGF